MSKAGQDQQPAPQKPHKDCSVLYSYTSFAKSKNASPKSKKIHRTNPDAGVVKPAIYALGPAPDNTNPPPDKNSG